MLLILSISLLAVYTVSKLYIPLAGVSWDESVHLYWVYQIHHALKAGSLSDFWHVTFSQFDYPPLQSWLLGIPLAPFGFSIRSVRIINALWLVVGSILIYRIGGTFAGKKGKITGIVSSLLFLTSPLMLLHASLAVKEMIGAVLNLAIIFVYILARKNNRPLYFFGVSFLLIMLFLIKYNYGILAAIAICLEAAVDIFSSKIRFKAFRSYLFIFVPFLAFTALWVSTSTERISKFIFILANSSIAFTSGLADSLGYLLFYLRAILLMYSPSIIIGILLLLSFHVAIILYFKDYRIRILWFSFVPNLIIGTLHTLNVQERYIFTSIPPLFILGAYIAVDLFTLLSSRTNLFVIARAFFCHCDPPACLRKQAGGEAISNYLRLLRHPAFGGVPRNDKKNIITLGNSSIYIVYIVLLILSFKIIADLSRLPQYTYAVGAYTQKSPIFNQTDYQDLWFDYDTTKWAKKLPPPSSEKPADVVKYVASNVDLSKPVEVVGRSNELAPPYFDLIFALHREKGNYPRLPYSSFVVTIEVLPNSRYYTRDFVVQNSFLLDMVKQVENNPLLKPLAQKTFQEIGIKVAIYIPR